MTGPKNERQTQSQGAPMGVALQEASGSIQSEICPAQRPVSQRSGNADDCNGVGADRSDAGQRAMDATALANTAGLAGNFGGDAGNSRFPVGLDPRERLAPHLLPMAIVYLALHSRLGRQVLSAHLENQGLSHQRIDQWLLLLGRHWRNRVIGGYAVTAAVCFFARRMLETSGHWLSLLGAVALLMAVASAVHYYRADPVAQEDGL